MTDRAGNVIVAAYTSHRITEGDMLVIKYSNAGVALWTNRYNGPANGSDQPWGVAVDGSGNVFVTGESLGTNGSSDYVTLAYSSGAVPLWTNRYNGPANGDDQSAWKQSMAVVGPGSVVVVGASDGDFGTGTAISDYVVVRNDSFPTIRATARSNQSVELTWPGGFVGWHLDRATGPQSLGSSNDWMTVAGSTSTNRIIFPFAAGSVSAFFRLANP